MTEQKFFILDAFALIFRAYYAFIKNPRINSKGFNTSAIFGFTNTLLEILKKENPSHIAVAFDYPAPNFRVKIYPEYKANRDATPEDIKLSTPIIKELIKAMGIKVIEKEGYEADDIVGTITRTCINEGLETFMMTSDKDYAQLVDDCVHMYKPGRSGGDVQILKVADINEKYGLDNPMQFIDILALMGDASDNVPGAPGVGEKTAIKLISQYKSVENLLENTHELKGKQKEKIEENKDLILLSKQLVTIHNEVPLDYILDDFKIGEPDKDKVIQMFDDLEFRNMIQRVFPESSKAASPTAVQGSLFDMPEANAESATPLYDNIETVKHDYHMANTDAEIDALISKLQSAKAFCFDTETTGLDVLKDELVGMSFAINKHEAWYVPVSANADEAKVRVEKFRTVFADEKIEKIAQNMKFDMQILKAFDIEIKGTLFDTMIAHYLLQPELRHNMDFLAETYLKYKPIPIETLIGKKGKSTLSMRNIAVEKVVDYAAEDADITLQLAIILKEELKTNNLFELYEKIEAPLISVLCNMELYGVKINEPELKEYSKVLQEEATAIEQKIFELAGMEFNISSPKQLGDVLFEKLAIDPNAKKTKTNQYSTSEETLQKLADKHPIIENIFTFRSLRKLISTYVEALPKLVHPETGKLHTSFNQTITATGRLSSNNPNLQNIPIREERGREIRKAFISSDKEHVFLSADYSQIELRLMAHMSNDEHMIAAFNNNEDIHAATAGKIYNLAVNEVSKEQRSRAKTANFGIIYGIGATGLAQRLKITRPEAKELIEGYFNSYPAIKQYMDKQIAFARDHGYVETIFKRKRQLADINSRNTLVKSYAERNAVNAPIQGSAADIIKLAMINIHQKLQASYKSRMILQVHDELNFDVFSPELDEIKALVKNEMENAVALSVPLTVDMGAGENWLIAH